MNKLIIFDLDGVLIDSKLIHFHSLNMALSKINKDYIISEIDQKNIYEGIPTKTKLNILTKTKGLDSNLHEKIWSDKQEIVFDMLKNLEKDYDLIFYLNKIKLEGIKICVASNSIRKTIELSLNNLGIKDLVDYIVSNEDVANTKPHPEMYWKCMSYFNTIPEYTVIFEDSEVGIKAVKSSKANLVKVINRNDLNKEKIDLAINILQQTSKKNINILIPMAGAGNRFAEAGYSFPKPLIDIGGKTMIQKVVESININANYIYIVQDEHYEKYDLYTILNNITPGCNIIKINEITEGAALTCLKATNLINNNMPLIIANSDQIVEWDSNYFIEYLQNLNADGGIASFTSNHPKWSYAKINNEGLVSEVAEKRVISNTATVGIYYWKHGSDFVKYANQMINLNKRVNNEFYVCPIFNEAIEDNKKIYTVQINKMWGVGTPEDLRLYFENYIS